MEGSKEKEHLLALKVFRFSFCESLWSQDNFSNLFGGSKGWWTKDAKCIIESYRLYDAKWINAVHGGHYILYKKNLGEPHIHNKLLASFLTYPLWQSEDSNHCRQHEISVINLGKRLVMRLTKPTLMPYHPLISNPRDITHTLAELTAQSDIARTKNLDYFGVSNLLTLPQNFGNIFLGETFSSYISVHNDSQQKCTEIVMKIDLQTSSQRLMLSGVNLNPATELNPNQSIDDVIHHEVKELGTHILVCAVSYTAQQGEKMAFRKFFKFQVLKPLDVKTKFYNAESDDVYLEAQIQNITQGPIYMDHVSLEASLQYQARELNTSQGKQGSDVVFGKVDYLNPNDIRQYLYCLSPQPELYNDSHILKGVTNIGKLDIVWKTNMGEKGRLQTSQLQRVAPGYGDIRVTVEEVPDTVPMETTFKVVCRITNCCERSMDLTLVLQNNNSSGLLWCGLSGKKLGNLPKNDHIDLPLTMITTAPGLQTISGLRLIDNFLKRTYEQDELAQVFVCNDDSS